MSAHSSQRHDNCFDALRILAAMTVIYGHAHPLSGMHDPAVLGNSVQALAVKIFFIVSGFLVSQSWASDPRPVPYLAKRALRIFPGLLLLLLLSALVMGPMLTSLPLAEYFSNPGVHRYVWMNMALYPVYHLPGLFEANVYPHAVNGSLWSLPVEFLMYLTLPVVYALSRVERSNRLLVVFTLALCGASIYLVRIAQPPQPIVFWGNSLVSILDAAPYFFIGSLFAVTRMRAWLDPVVALFLVGVLLLLQPQGAVAMEVALYLVGPYAVLSLATRGHWVLSSAGRFGDPSYGLYLYGWPVQQSVFAIMGTDMSPLANTLISGPVAMLFAYGSWHLVEKRALRLKPRRAMRSPVDECKRSQVS